MQKQKSQYLNHCALNHNIVFQLYLNHCHPVIQYGTKLRKVKSLKLFFLPWPESYRSLRTWFSFLISFSWEFLFHAEFSCKIVCTSKMLRFCVDDLGWAHCAVLTLSEGFVLRLRYNCANSELYHSVQRSFCMGDLGCQGGWHTVTL